MTHHGRTLVVPILLALAFAVTAIVTATGTLAALRGPAPLVVALLGLGASAVELRARWLRRPPPARRRWDERRLRRLLRLAERTPEQLAELEQLLAERGYHGGPRSSGRYR